MTLQLVTLKTKKGTQNLQNKNTRTIIAQMFDNFSSNDCCYHIEDDGNRQFIQKFLRTDLETAQKIEEKPSAKAQTITGLWNVKNN